MKEKIMAKRKEPKQKTIIEVLGVFKLKDKQGRNGVRISLSKSDKDVTLIEDILIDKVQGESNKIKLSILWKSEAFADSGKEKNAKI